MTGSDGFLCSKECDFTEKTVRPALELPVADGYAGDSGFCGWRKSQHRRRRWFDGARYFYKFWNPGNDGVRITVVNSESGSAAAGPVDFSNRTQSGTIAHFGKVSKLSYRGGASLSLQSGVAYTCLKPKTAMPTIVSSGGAIILTPSSGTLQRVCLYDGSGGHRDWL